MIEELAQEIHKLLLEAVEKRCAEICKEKGYETAEESAKAGLRIVTDFGNVNGATTLGVQIILDGKPVSGWIHSVIKRDTHDEWIVEIREK